MTTARAKDPCPCGSGKRYKHCHMPQVKAKSLSTFWLLVAPVFVVLVVGMALWARQSSNPGGGALPAGTSVTPGVSGASQRAAADQGPLPGGRAAEDWEYDEAKDRYWSPDHGHWHEGKPPAPEQRVAPTASREANPNVPSPEDWQYDAESNQHYDPVHGHWHAGPPPPADQRSASATVDQPATDNPNIPNPEPWQYDALTNRHFHPQHGHWHNGPPPTSRDSS